MKNAMNWPPVWITSWRDQSPSDQSPSDQSPSDQSPSDSDQSPANQARRLINGAQYRNGVYGVYAIWTDLGECIDSMEQSLQLSQSATVEESKVSAQLRQQNEASHSLYDALVTKFQESEQRLKGVQLDYSIQYERAEDAEQVVQAMKSEKAVLLDKLDDAVEMLRHEYSAHADSAEVLTKYLQSR